MKNEVGLIGQSSGLFKINRLKSNLLSIKYTENRTNFDQIKLRIAPATQKPNYQQRIKRLFWNEEAVMHTEHFINKKA